MRIYILIAGCLTAICVVLMLSTSSQRSGAAGETEPISDPVPPMPALPATLSNGDDVMSRRVAPRTASAQSDSQDRHHAPASDEDDGAELAVVRAELERAREECRRVEQELDECRHPGTSPLGAFVRLPEYATMSDSSREYIRSMLDDLPVRLQPGEGAWIAERVERDDWKLFAKTTNETLIGFLGPGRVLAEMPPELVRELRERYSDEKWLRLFGNR